MINTTVKLFRGGIKRLPGKSKAIEIKSEELRSRFGLRVICPINFQVSELKNSSSMILVTNPMIPGLPPRVRPKHTYLTVDCVSCPSSFYTLHSGEYYLPALSSTNNLVSQDVKPTVRNPECNPCPTGKNSFKLYDTVTKRRFF